MIRTINELSEQEIKYIMELKTKELGEKIEIAYTDNKFNNKSTIVVITNYNFFKYEDGKLTVIPRYLITDYRFESRGPLHWDKIHCKLFDGNEKHIGLFPTDSAKHFLNHLKTHKCVNPNEEMNRVKHQTALYEKDLKEYTMSSEKKYEEDVSNINKQSKHKIGEQIDIENTILQVVLQKKVVEIQKNVNQEASDQINELTIKKENDMNIVSKQLKEKYNI